MTREQRRQKQKALAAIEASAARLVPGKARERALREAERLRAELDGTRAPWRPQQPQREPFTPPGVHGVRRGWRKRHGKGDQ